MPTRGAMGVSIGGQDIFPVWNNRATATPQWCEGQPSSQSKTSYRIEFSVNYHFNSPITLFVFDLPIIHIVYRSTAIHLT